MASLIGQTLAVALSGALLYALLAGLGVRLPFVRSLGVAALVLFAIASVSSMREGWHRLDLLREQTAKLPRARAEATCTGVGVDGRFLAFVGSRIPVRERFFMEVAPRLSGAGDICIRFLLLPRLQVERLEGARYVVLWDYAPPERLRELRERGYRIERFRRRHYVARLP